jgi:hypothetical protein
MDTDPTEDIADRTLAA